MSNLAYLGKRHDLSDSLAKSLGKIMKKAGMMSDDDYDDLRNEFRQSRNRYNCSDGMCGADDCSRCHPEGMGEEGGEEEVAELNAEELAEELKDEAISIVYGFKKSEVGTPLFNDIMTNLVNLPEGTDENAVITAYVERMLPLIQEWYAQTPMAAKRPWDAIKGEVAREAVSWLE